MRLIVYTSVLGATDPLHEPRCASDAEFVCFTDQPIESDRWSVVRMPVQAAPSRATRILKCNPQLLFPEADAWLWIDAAFELLQPPERIVAASTAGIVGMRHPDRRRIVDECEAIIKAGKGLAAPTRAQLAAYQAEGWDTDADPQDGITNGGFLLRRNIGAVRHFNRLWDAEVQDRTLRDQMSIDYCAWRAGVAIEHLPGHVRKNAWARLHILRGKRTNDF